MKEKLTKLYNTMAQIETKGESTKLMAACLNFVTQMVNECSVPVSTEESKEGD